MAARLLLVEDDPAILRGLELNLQLEGYELVAAADGKAAIEALDEGSFDLVVLDVMLPHVNGYQIVEKLRRQRNDVPVILISAKTAEVDIVMGLDVGADDYVTKPFRVAELLARVKAHLRRRGPANIVRFGDTEVDREQRTVKRGNEPVSLTAKEFDLLELLLLREGRALTRDSILAQVWGHGYFGTDRTVDNFITKLRQKLDTPSNPKHFLTVRGIGYRFVSEES